MKSGFCFKRISIITNFTKRILEQAEAKKKGCLSLKAFITNLLNN